MVIAVSLGLNPFAGFVCVQDTIDAVSNSVKKMCFVVIPFKLLL